jgi:putative membrane protein
MHGMAEVQLGQLAQDKAVSDEVKQFGARMVQDHGKSNDELKQVASSKGIQLPTGPDKKHVQNMQKLQKLSGAEFDREYMKHIVDDHKKDVSEFHKQSKSANDPEIRNFAAKTLPTLQQHLKLAQSVNDAIKAGKSGSRG